MILVNILGIMINNTLDFSQYNGDVLNRLKEINEEIVKETSKDYNNENNAEEKTDWNKVTKLRMAQLMRGLELNYGSDWNYV